MITEKKYKVIIIDDHHLIRDGIKNFIIGHEKFEFVEEFDDTRTLLNSNFKENPDVIILDLNLSGIDGAKSCPLLKNRFPACKIIAYTQYYGLEKELSKIGFDGYAVKSERDSLIEALTTVLEGGKYFKSSSKNSFSDHSETEKMDPFLKIKKLTTREIQVAKYMVDGFSNREIGEKIFISESTVETHRKHIKEKLEVKNKSELYALLKNL